MNQVVADQSLTRQLGGLNEPCVIVDTAGKKLGLFCPEVDRSLYDGVDSPASEEELDRRSREGGGRTLAEIMSDLERRA